MESGGIKEGSNQGDVRLTIAYGLAWFCSYGSLRSLSDLKDELNCHFKLTSPESAVLATFFLVGWTIGAFAYPYMSTLMGSKKTAIFAGVMNVAAHYAVALSISTANKLWIWSIYLLGIGPTFGIVVCACGNAVGIHASKLRHPLSRKILQRRDGLITVLGILGNMLGAMYFGKIFPLLKESVTAGSNYDPKITSRNITEICKEQLPRPFYQNMLNRTEDPVEEHNLKQVCYCNVHYDKSYGTNNTHKSGGRQAYLEHVYYLKMGTMVLLIIAGFITLETVKLNLSEAQKHEQQMREQLTNERSSVVSGTEVRIKKRDPPYKNFGFMLFIVSVFVFQGNEVVMFDNLFPILKTQLDEKTVTSITSNALWVELPVRLFLALYLIDHKWLNLNVTYYRVVLYIGALLGMVAGLVICISVLAMDGGLQRALAWIGCMCCFAFSACSGSPQVAHIMDVREQFTEEQFKQAQTYHMGIFGFSSAVFIPLSGLLKSVAEHGCDDSKGLVCEQPVIVPFISAIACILVAIGIAIFMRWRHTRAIYIRQSMRPTMGYAVNQ